MNRRDFLKAGAAALVAPALVSTPEAGPDPVILSNTYCPDRWRLHVHQPLTPMGEARAVAQVGLGHKFFTSLPGFPNPMGVFESRPLVAKPDGSWWEFVPDRDAAPQYYLVGPARFTVEHDGVLVADSGEGRHWEGRLEFDGLFEWSKAGTGQPFDESKLAPLAAQISRHLTDAGYWRMFEIFQHDRLAALVLRHQSFPRRLLAAPTTR